MVEAAREEAGPGPIRALNLPEPVEVEEGPHQRPVAITFDRRGQKVDSVEDVWEVVDEWWRPYPIARRYYKVVLEDGTSLTVFHDLLNGAWLRQRA